MKLFGLTGLGFNFCHAVLFTAFLPEEGNHFCFCTYLFQLALEQLWSADDFHAFRRLMTRKNIDLQLQSLELLVSKYGVLSPSFRNSTEERPGGEDGEEDFLQVVIRYADSFPDQQPGHSPPKAKGSPSQPHKPQSTSRKKQQAVVETKVEVTPTPNPSTSHSHLPLAPKASKKRFVFS